MAKLRRAIVRAEREDDLVEASAPVGLLAGVAERGEVARSRLFLIAGQGAALIVAFAAFAAAMRRGESRLFDEQLDTLAASRGQALAARAVQALVPTLAGVLVALGGFVSPWRWWRTGEGFPPRSSRARFPSERCSRSLQSLPRALFSSSPRRRRGGRVWGRRAGACGRDGAGFPLGTGTYVNLMAQYYVSGRVGQNRQYEEIGRGIHRQEYERALALARELGLRLDPRSVGERHRLAHAS